VTLNVLISGPKPLKRFTPPPDYTKDSGSSEEESSEGEDSEEDETDHVNNGVIRASDKVEDEFLKAVSFNHPIPREWFKSS